jgi:hypothetical protein
MVNVCHLPLYHISGLDCAAYVVDNFFNTPHFPFHSGVTNLTSAGHTYVVGVTLGLLIGVEMIAP